MSATLRRPCDRPDGCRGGPRRAASPSSIAGAGAARVVLPDGHDLHRHYSTRRTFSMTPAAARTGIRRDRRSGGRRRYSRSASQSVDAARARSSPSTPVAGGLSRGYGGDGRRAVRAEFAGIADVDELPGRRSHRRRQRGQPRPPRERPRRSSPTVAGGGRSARSARTTSAAASRCRTAPHRRASARPRSTQWGGFELLALPTDAQSSPGPHLHRQAHRRDRDDPEARPTHRSPAPPRRRA